MWAPESYDFPAVAACVPGTLEDSVLLKLEDRGAWLSMVDEIVGLCDEGSVVRQLATPTPPPQF